MKRFEWLMLVALSLLWGGSFFFVELALAGVGPLTVVLGRVGLAAVVLYFFASISGQRMPVSLRAWSALMLLGFINNALPFVLIAWGQTHITGGLAAILNATTPLFTVLLAHVLTRDERITPHKLAGVALGLAGVTVLIGPQMLQGLGADVLGQCAILGAALCYSLGAIYARRFHIYPPIVIATAQVTAASLLVLPAALAIEQPWTLAMPGAPAIGAILGLAVLSTALAYIIYFRLLASAGPTNLVLVTFLIPVSAVLLGTLILGETIAPNQLAGMALIGCGLAAVDGRVFRWLLGPRRPG